VPNFRFKFHVRRFVRVIFRERHRRREETALV